MYICYYYFLFCEWRFIASRETMFFPFNLSMMSDRLASSHPPARGYLKLQSFTQWVQSHIHHDSLPRMNHLSVDTVIVINSFRYRVQRVTRLQIYANNMTSRHFFLSKSINDEYKRVKRHRSWHYIHFTCYTIQTYLMFTNRNWELK